MERTIAFLRQLQASGSRLHTGTSSLVLNSTAAFQDHGMLAANCKPPCVRACRPAWSLFPVSGNDFTYIYIYIDSPYIVPTFVMFAAP